MKHPPTNRHSGSTRQPSHSAGKKAAQPLDANNQHSQDDEVIRLTAYAIYEARGRADGHALDDWLQAQAQIGRTAEQASAECEAAALQP